jgi:hypothetical protein
MDNAELDEIEARCLASTPGPWEWRDGVHTEDARTSDAGGIHTQSPVMRVTPDGRPFDDDNVVFPVGKISGQPYWVEKFTRATAEGKRPLSIALELFATPEDKAFILASRGDMLKLLAEVRRLRASRAC